MRRILRSVGSVVLGFIVGTIIMLGVEFADQTIFPLPAGVNPRDPASLKAAMPNLPAGALVIVLAGWAAGTLAGAWVASRVAQRSKMTHGMFAGILFLGAGIADLLQFPHPLWFWVIGLASFLPAAYAGARLAVGGTAPHSS